MAKQPTKAAKGAKALAAAASKSGANQTPPPAKAGASPAIDLGASPGAAATPPPASETPAEAPPSEDPATKPGVNLEVVPGASPTPEKSAGNSGFGKDGLPEASKMPKGFTVEESSRDPQESIAQYVKIAEGGVGLTVTGPIPLEEFLPTLDYLTGLQEKIGFLVGDFLVYGVGEYKERLVWAMAKTKRDMSTLKAYMTVSRALPLEARVPALSWKHHQAVTPIANDPERGLKVVAEALRIAEKGEDGKAKEIMTTRDFQNVVKRKFPKKKKPAKKTNAKKPGRKTRSQKAGERAQKNGPVPLTPKETEAMDRLFPALQTFKAAAIALNDILSEEPEAKNADKKARRSLVDAILTADRPTKVPFNKDFPLNTVQQLAKRGLMIWDHTGAPETKLP